MAKKRNHQYQQSEQPAEEQMAPEVETTDASVNQAPATEQAAAPAQEPAPAEQESAPVTETPAEPEKKEELEIDVTPKKEEKLDLSTPADLKEPAAPAEAPKKATVKPAAPKSRELIELTKMLDMYRDMCKIRTMDPAKLRERMRVLFSIVRLVAPSSSSTSIKYSTRELVETLFNRMVEGSGTIFSDGYIFRLTYSLPPQDAVKFETFYSALLQLVNARLRGAKITFNMDVLRDVLKNESVMAAIRSIRSRFN